MPPGAVTNAAPGFPKHPADTSSDGRGVTKKELRKMAYSRMSARALKERLERRIRGIIRGIRLRTGAAGRALRNLVAEAVARSVRIGAIVDELFARNRGKDVAKVYNWAFGRALAV